MHVKNFKFLFDNFSLCELIKQNARFFSKIEMLNLMPSIALDFALVQA